MRLRLVTAPVSLPVSVDEARGQVEAYGTTHDVKLTQMIRAAVSHLDGRDGLLGRALLEQEWEMTLDEFPAGALCVPLPPLRAVTAVTYTDGEGVTQTLPTASYRVLAGEGGKVVPAFGTTWPRTRGEPDAVSVRFVAGYGASAADVPEAIRSAILLIVGDLFENREAKIVGTIVAPNETVDMLLFPFRIVRP